MRMLALVALAACSAPARVQTDDASVVDAAIQPEERRVREVLIGDRSIIWAHADLGSCNHDLGCFTTGPALTYWNRTTGSVDRRVEGGTGSPAIVGTESSFFIVTGDDFDHMFIRRIDGDDVVNFSPPHALTSGPAVDAQYVYWSESDYQGSTFFRATRDGDGSDRTVLAELSASIEPRQLVAAAGYLWWNGSAGTQRVATLGGEVGNVETMDHLAVVGDDVYGIRTTDGQQEVGTLDANGTFTPIASHVYPTAARYIAVTDDAVYWSTGDGNIYTAPLAGGAVETIAAHDDIGHVFAVLPDRILTRFTRDGFAELPRP